MKFVVLSSSRGTTMQAVFDAIKKGELHAECLGLITDKADRGCAEKARAGGVRVEVVEKMPGEDRVIYDKRIHLAIEKLAGKEKPIIACLGWMWMLSPGFVEQWKNKIVNVHPSLLPKHPGIHAHDLVIKNKEKESGMTIHLIDAGMDTGKILLQKSCPVLPDDTVETLKKRVQELECEWYPRVLEMIAKKEITLS